MAINSVTDLRNTDAGQTAFTVRQNPVGGSTACHAMQVTQAATSGDGGGINVVSNNTAAPAIRAKAAGPLIQLYDASNALKFGVSNTGAVTLYDALAVTTLTTSGNVSVGGTLGVTGAATLASVAVTGNATVGGTLGVTGTSTLGATTVSAADLTIQGTNKAYRLRRGGGGLDFEATGADLLLSNWSGTNFDGTQRSYFRFSADAQNIQVAGKVEFVDALYGSTKHVLDGAANTIGFFGTAAAAKQTVSGAKGGNAAVASILTALVAYGLVTDSTSA